jgi:NAD(P)-dependent dehydrogenase (short-subunit alcohol dehydrogenase family)
MARFTGKRVLITGGTSGIGLAGARARRRRGRAAGADRRGWATALADRGIRVNVLVPGAISTSLRSFMSDDVREDFEHDVVSRVPLGRIGTADEAAAVALFLLSDDASYVTASQHAVDGGLTKR